MMKTKLPPPVSVSPKRKLPVLDAETVKKTVLEKCAPADFKTYGKGKNKVYILPEAAKELEGMIYFGQARAVNHYEQQYQGLGYLFEDAEGRVTAVITHFLYIYSASRGELFASVCKGDTTILDLLDNERTIYNRFESDFNDYDGTGRYVINPFLKYGKSIVVLNGHTHPGLTCFFSGPDRASSYACEDFPAITMVCDPITKDYKAMAGFDEDTEVIVFSYASENNTSREDNGTADKIKEIFEGLCKIKGIKGKLKLARGNGNKLNLSLSFGYKPDKKE